MTRKIQAVVIAGLFTALIYAVIPTARSAHAFSSNPWATYYAPKRARAIRIDGDLSDWADVKGFTMAQERFFFVGQGMSSAQWKGPADLSARFKLQWDDQYLYIGVEVTDDHVTEPHGSLVPGPETGSWDDDGIEIMLDNDGCGMPRYYVGDPMHHEFHFVYSATHPFVFDNFWKALPGAPQPMFTLPDGTVEPLAYPGEVMVKHEITRQFSGPPYQGRYAFLKTPQGYNLEVRMELPGATMKAVNEGGQPIGFDLAVNDNDTGSGPSKQQLHWSGVNDKFWRNTQFFGTLILLNR